MAKSLRSKSKRKNRSVLRKQISEPLVKKRLENLHEALQKEIKLKAKNVLAGLKKVLTKDNGNAAIKMETDDNNENDDNDDEEEEEENNGNTTLKKQEKKLARVALLLGKKKGKKPRKDTGKKLEWF